MGGGEYFLHCAREGIRPFGREQCLYGRRRNRGGATGHYFQPGFVIASPAAATAAGLWRRSYAGEGWANNYYPRSWPWRVAGRMAGPALWGGRANGIDPDPGASPVS